MDVVVIRIDDSEAQTAIRAMQTQRFRPQSLWMAMLVAAVIKDAPSFADIEAMLPREPLKFDLQTLPDDVCLYRKDKDKHRHKQQWICKKPLSVRKPAAQKPFVLNRKGLRASRGK